MLFDISLSNTSLNMFPQAKQARAEINKLDYMKLKRLCTAREIMNKMERVLTKWEKIFANIISNKGLISNIYKELIQLNMKNNPI